MTFTDLSAQSSDPSLYLLKVPIVSLSTVQGLTGYVSGQPAVDDPASFLVQVVPGSNCDQYIRQ